MIDWLKDINDWGFKVFEWLAFIYIVPIFLIYIFRAFNALYINLKFKGQKKAIDEQIENLATSPLTVGISIIAPAYNESATIIGNIRSLLMVKYPEFQVIIVNDGSKDDSIEKITEAYDLYEADEAPLHNLKSENVIKAYKSKNPAFHRLLILDKVNGGKSDALNGGINYAKYPLIACMDVDSIFTNNALLKLARPFMLDPSVIAAGSSIRIANNCKVENGHLRKVRIPKGFWERFQVLEYLRAFLLGRMSLSKINGLPLVSGASGLFKKNLVVEVGGYDTDTVGEDMELIVRMRRHAYEHKMAHKVTYIPDPICWTEAPFDPQSLKKQRNRWTRGSIETLLKHRRMLFNRKYGVLGLYSLPYWLLYELALPLSMFIGILFVSLGLITGAVDLKVFSLLFLFGYSFSIFVSVITLLIEELTYRQYSKIQDIALLFILSLIEVFVYLPFSTYWSLTGIWDKLRNKSVGWGTITRAGFSEGKQ